MTKCAARHPGRVRRIAGRLLLSLAAVAGVLLVVSCWWSISLVVSRTMVNVNGGRLTVVVYEDLPRRFFTSSVWQPTGMSWWGWRTFEGSGERFTGIRGAAWPLPAALLALAVLLPRSGLLARRNVRIGHCPHCNYDKRGIAHDALCPECGK